MRWLIAKGLLSEEKIPGGQTIYRLNAGKIEEAEHLVKESGSGVPGRSRRAGKR